MKAVRIHEYGPATNLRYEDVPEPAPGRGDVVVAVAAMGVNPADHKYRSGMFSEIDPRPMPLTIGMDIVGRVTEVGPDVEGLAVDVPVIAMLYVMGNGGYAEKVAVPAKWCGPWPKGLDAVLAATIPTPGLTAFQWIEDAIAPEPGTRILVTGATGAVGRIACYVARKRGAIVTAAVRAKYAASVDHADHVLLIGKDGLAGEQTFDVIADTIGGTVAGQAMKLLKSDGYLSTVATDPITAPEGIASEIRFFGNHADGERLGRVAQAVATGELTIETPTVLPLSQAAKAHALIEEGEARKVVLVPDFAVQSSGLQA